MRSYLLYYLVILSLIWYSEAAPNSRKCKPKCGENEIFQCSVCGEAICGDPIERENCFEQQPECGRESKQCFCKDGYARNNGICIPENDCFSRIIVPDCKIDEYEHLQLTISYGNPTCRNRQAPYPQPSNINNPPRCVCDIGRVRNAKGECILPTECKETDNNHIYETNATNTDTPLPPIIFEKNGKSINSLLTKKSENSKPLLNIQKSDSIMPKINLVPPPPPFENV